MLKENYTKEEKMEIASHIKNISFEEMEEEMERLMEIGIDAHSISERSRIGNNVVDKSILGGFIAKFDDQMLDMSTKGKLSELKDKILEAESIAMTNIIDSINTHTQIYLDSF